MKTLAEIIPLSAQYLNQKGISQARRDAEDLIANVLSFRRLDLYLHFDRPVEERELEELRDKLSRRARGEPLQYILGKVDFYHCALKVTPDVLIPRQETEILVDKVSEELKKWDLKDRSLLDLCCGSGCIGVSLKKRFPDLRVVATDVSCEALKVAKENCFQNQVEIELLEGDFLDAVRGELFDFVVCNPPYISEFDFDKLENSVREFEPRQALVAPERGLGFYKRFAKSGRAVVKKGGKVWFEIGYNQGSSIKEIFLQPCWKNLNLEKDWSGKDRFFSLETE
ncbi:MAG: peptide chain release factor N(5)-glutamine methyltransferase [Parachlamydiaceae bacterium]